MGPVRHSKTCSVCGHAGSVCGHADGADAPFTLPCQVLHTTAVRPSRQRFTSFARPAILPVTTRNPNAKSFPNPQNPKSTASLPDRWTLRKGQNNRFAVEFPTPSASWTPCPCPPQNREIHDFTHPISTRKVTSDCLFETLSHADRDLDGRFFDATGCGPQRE